MAFFDTANFDASKVEPNTAFKPFPPGDYAALIKVAGEGPTKNRKGTIGTIEYVIVAEGPAKGRRITQRINLRNENPKAVEIGQGELSALCRAVGIIRPRSWSEFTGKLVVIKVVMEKRDDAGHEGELSNKFGGIVLKEGATAGAPGAPVAAPIAGPAPWAAPAAPATPAAAPWTPATPPAQA
jgi:hypothetical protein